MRLFWFWTTTGSFLTNRAALDWFRNIALFSSLSFQLSHRTRHSLQFSVSCITHQGMSEWLCSLLCVQGKLYHFQFGSSEVVLKHISMSICKETAKDMHNFTLTYRLTSSAKCCCGKYNEGHVITIWVKCSNGTGARLHNQMSVGCTGDWGARGRIRHSWNRGSWLTEVRVCKGLVRYRK